MDVIRADHQNTVEMLLQTHADNLEDMERSISQRDQKLVEIVPSLLS
jgi:hypothetical protein